MAKRVEGVTEKLLESAKNEFLSKGYENASLQAIAEKADSSKGAIYIRYPDKESLYRALVEPTTDEFCHLLERELQRFRMLPSDEQKEKVMTFGNDGFSKVVAYIYNHFDEFKLIITSGENSTYQEFIHRIFPVLCSLLNRQEMTRFPPDGLHRNWRTFCPVLFMPGYLKWLFTICPKIRLSSISKGCEGFIMPDGRRFLKKMRGDAFEWVD